MKTGADVDTSNFRPEHHPNCSVTNLSSLVDLILNHSTLKMVL